MAKGVAGRRGFIGFMPDPADRKSTLSGWGYIPRGDR